MIFTKLNIENFMSFEQAVVPLEGQGLVMVCGENLDNSMLSSNGAGKSVIFEALVWGLYGKTCRGNKGILKDGARECNVSVGFRTNEGNKYTICRTQRKSGVGLSLGVSYAVSHPVAQGHTEVVSLDEGTIRGTQAKIEGLLGCDFNTFTNAIMLSQDHLVPFASATDKSQKAVLESILGIDIYDEAQRVANELLKQAETAIDNIGKELYRLGQRQVEIQADINVLMAQAEKAEVQRKEKEKQREVEKAKQERARKEHQEHLAGWLLDEKEKQEQLDNWPSDAELDKLTKASQAELDEANGQLKAKDAEVNRLRLEQKRVAGFEGGVCPTCYQDVPPEAVESVSNELEAKRCRVSKSSSVLRDEVRKLQEAHDVVGQLKERVAVVDKQLVKIKSEVLVVEAKVSTCDEAIVRLSEPIEPVDEGLTDLIKGKEQALADIINSIPALQEKVFELEQSLGPLRFWEKGFGRAGMRSFILDSVTQPLNRWANEYLAEMMEGIRIEFKTVTQLASGEFRDKFSIDVSHSSGRDEYLSNSGGERRRIDFAIMLALRRLAASRAVVPFNVVFYDEVFEKLDDAGTDAVMRILEHESLRCDSIFVISHDDSLKDAFPGVWIVRKASGISTLEV